MSKGNDFKLRATAAGINLRGGQRRALEEIIILYKNKIFNLAYRYTGETAEASDLSQDIFIKLFTKIHLFNPVRDFDSWFMQLAINTAINTYRKKKKTPDITDISDHSGLEHKKQNNKEILNQQVNHLLSRLNKRERMAITLQIWETRDIKEIADVMETSSKAVEALLFRARSKLRKQVNSEKQLNLL